MTQKAKEGVKVRVLYDELGSRQLTKGFFKAFREAGGEAEAFFPSKLRFINLRLNYRNHRKLAIIDGNIGYVGGFNVGDEYLGLNSRFGYWRDTHLRIQGEAVYAMQVRFILTGIRLRIITISLTNRICFPRSIRPAMSGYR